MKLAIIAITDSGLRIAKKIKTEFPDSDILQLEGKGKLSELVEENFPRYQGFIFIMATGIVIRTIAPLIKNKYEDPAVVVVDDACRYSISLLSGHEGGANMLAWDVAAVLGCEPVVTTASDTNKHYILGIGCRRGVSSESIKEAITEVLRETGIGPDELRCIASVVLKRDEEGLKAACMDLGVPLRFFSKQEINRFDGPFEHSKAAMENLGIKGVCEPCALMAGRNTILVVKKRVINQVALAVARELPPRESLQ